MIICNEFRICKSVNIMQNVASFENTSFGPLLHVLVELLLPL